MGQLKKSGIRYQFMQWGQDSLTNRLNNNTLTIYVGVLLFNND
jgi:hypothetical protein